MILFIHPSTSTSPILLELPYCLLSTHEQFVHDDCFWSLEVPTVIIIAIAVIKLHLFFDNIEQPIHDLFLISLILGQKHELTSIIIAAVTTVMVTFAFLLHFLWLMWLLNSLSHVHTVVIIVFLNDFNFLFFMFLLLYFRRLLMANINRLCHLNSRQPPLICGQQINSVCHRLHVTTECQGDSPWWSFLRLLFFFTFFFCTLMIVIGFFTFGHLYKSAHELFAVDWALL